MDISDLSVRNANANEIFEIHEILSRSFEPYKKYYTEAALNETVISPEEIEKRISEINREVLVVIGGTRTVGTATTTQNEKNSLYISSMAVRPEYQRIGIGWYILDEIYRLAEKIGCVELSLETYEPLKPALNLYEKYGFMRTGKKRDLYGIEIFEMIKKVE